MSRFLSQKINKLKPYVPGEQPKERKYVKLNTNESPFPPSKLAQKLAKIESKKLYLYPDPDVTELTKTVAETYGVGQENVILTNGSDEVLNFAFMAFCDENRQAVFPDITYGFYKVFAMVNGINYTEIKLKDDFTIDINDYINAKGTIFIANPNAPTGIALTIQEIEKIVASDRDRIVVVDEAYVDFGAESAISLINKYDNLLVTQTFSKSRSMAGARLGFGIASKELISDLVRIKYSTNPYNVNRMTAAAGVGSLKDDKYFKDNCQKIIDVRDSAMIELKKLGFSCTNSQANFIFAKHEKLDGKDLYEKLKKHGVLVRHFDSERIKDYNRITVGSKKQMQIFLTAVQQILEESK